MNRLLSCEFNIDTGNVELRYADGSMISIDCTEVEKEVAMSINARSELDWLIYNAPLDYAKLVLCGDLEGYLRQVSGPPAFCPRQLFPSLTFAARLAGTALSPLAHTSLDAFPLSIHKYQMVLDLIDDENMTDGNNVPLYDKRWEILFDFGEYHTRWSSLVEEDFCNQTNLESNSAVWKGASPLIAIASRNKHVYTEDNHLYDELARDYLVRMIQLCTDKNIDLLLINTGYDCSDEAKYFADSVNEIAKQHEISYIDFTGLDIINFESDLQTSGHNTHVNFSGAEKFTSFIGQRLSEQYQLSDYRNNEEYNSWWHDYQAYVNSKADYLRQQNSLDLYLMFLADNDYDIIIEMLDRSIINEENNMCMLENLGIDRQKLNDTGNLLVIDMLNRKVSYLSNNYESGSKWISVLGEIHLRDETDRQQEDIDTYGMYLNGQELYVANTSESARIRITVIRRDSGEVIDVHMF